MRQDKTLCTELMDKAASGDDAAFGALALAVQDDLFRFALAHSLRQADAAEVAQETFLRAYRGRTSWRTGSDVMGWLYGIAMNVVREFHRRNSRRTADGVELDTLAGSEAARPSGRTGEEDRPGAALDVATRNEVLSAALAKLPPRQQEAVSCRYLLQLSLQETAAIMGCAEGTVKAAVFAGLANLKKIVRQEPA